MTFGTMKTRIAGEILRTDLESQIGDAINSAISHYESEPWWFLEKATTESALQTTASSATVSLPSTFVSLVMLLITDGSDTFPLIQRTQQELDDRFTSDGSDEGTPVEFALLASTIRLWPIPDAAYVLTLRHRAELTTLSDDDDTNSWMTVGEELIRQRARADVVTSYLMQEGGAENIRRERAAFAARGLPFLSAAERSAYTALKRRNNAIMATGRVRPTRF